MPMQMGKNTGDDFVDQKITLPTILAWQDGDAEERAFWQRTLGEADFAEGDLEHAQALLTAHDAVNRSVAVAHDHAVKAGAALAPAFIGDERTCTAGPRPCRRSTVCRAPRQLGTVSHFAAAPY